MTAKASREQGEHRSDGQALITAFLAGEPDAVHEIAGWIRAVARHRAWGFTDAEDVVQLVLLELVTGFREGRFTGGNLRGFVCRVARTRCIDHYRRRRVRQGTVTLAGEVSDSGTQGATEARLSLERVLTRLDAGCRRLLLQAYLLELTRREIASLLGIAEGTVRVRLHRCLQAARRIVEGEGS